MGRGASARNDAGIASDTALAIACDTTRLANMIDRRAAMGMLAALPLALSAPALARRPARTLPRRLAAGATVGLVAPASAVTEEEIADSIFTMRAMGLVPRLGENVSQRHGYLAGTDAQRAADLDAMFADEDVAAIFAIGGGWGAARLLDLLDWDMIRRNPKLMIGYSDITALHLAIATKTGFASLHAQSANGTWPKESWESLWRLGFTGETPTLGSEKTVPGFATRTITGGKAHGRLLGGNLTILSTLMGTQWLPDFAGAILFVEDVDEAEYRIDRMLQQLKLAGMLQKLSGIVIGSCNSCITGDADYDGLTLDQLIHHYIRPLGIPAFAGANIGHHYGQLTLPHGGQVELDAEARTIRLLEPIVR